MCKKAWDSSLISSLSIMIIENKSWRKTKRDWEFKHLMFIMYRFCVKLVISLSPREFFSQWWEWLPNIHCKKWPNLNIMNKYCIFKYELINLKWQSHNACHNYLHITVYKISNEFFTYCFYINNFSRLILLIYFESI